MGGRHRKMATVVLIVSLLGAVFSMGVVLPLPVADEELVAVRLIEHSLLLCLPALGVLFLAVRGESSHRRSASIALCAFTIFMSAYPRFAARPTPRATMVPRPAKLSLKRYFLGSTLPVARVESKTFATVEGQAMELEVFAPMQRPPELRPAVVVVPWGSSPKTTFTPFNRWLVREGYIVVDIAYRRLKVPSYRSAPSDVKCALGWLSKNAESIGVDPKRIALLGRSTGGRLALLAAYTDDDAFGSSCEGEMPKVRAIVSLYGGTDLTWNYNHVVNARTYNTKKKLEAIFGGSPMWAAAHYAAASPITYVREGLPPTLLVHGGRDQVLGVSQMDRLDQALSTARVPHESVLVPYAQHVFDINFDGWGWQATEPHVLAFLKQHL